MKKNSTWLFGFFFFLLQLKKLRMFATMVFLMCYRNAGMQVAAIIHVSDEYRL